MSTPAKKGTPKRPLTGAALLAHEQANKRKKAFAASQKQAKTARAPGGKGQGSPQEARGFLSWLLS